MGFIQEAIKHPTIDFAEITVDEQTKNEQREPYSIITLDISYSSIKTPDDLIELGKWITEKGKYIKSKYDSKGKIRKSFINRQNKTTI